MSCPQDSGQEIAGDNELVFPDEAATPEVRIGSGTALTLISKIVGLGTSFIIGVLVARAFGVAGKGTLSIVMMVPGLLVIVLDLGVSTSIIYYVSRGETPPGTAAANSLVMAFIMSVLGAPIIYVLLHGPLAIVEGVPPWAVASAMMILPTSLLAGWLSSISVGLSDLRLPLWYSIASSLATLVALSVLVLTGHGSITAVVAFSVAGTLVGIAVYIWGLRRHLRPFRTDTTAARKMARFSAKAYLSSIAGLLHERQDVLLLGWMAGASAVGLYSVGVSFAELAWYVPGALGSAILAKGSRRSDVSAVDYTTRTTRVAMVFLMITVLVSALVVPWLVPHLYGSSFTPAVLVFFALVPGVVADGISRILWSFQITRGRMYWRLSTGTMLLNAVAVVALVPFLGAVGAGLASTISYCVLAVFVIKWFCRDTGATLGEVLVPRQADLEVIFKTAARMVGR